ncbi:hypothetical protein GCK32_006847 [Trichostrongylus colubriformis]|uniref:Uncharacterized protein n=1 Tax=Trichostrongylus colubriformis TaxID=6319 RepID=A0AAN8IBI5_TRICO
MHGFSDPHDLAEVVLRNVGMAGHADKMLRYCRQVVAVACYRVWNKLGFIQDMSQAEVEFTMRSMPARREVWEVLSMMRESSESAMMLTSHSMDECEALCSRIAILRKGRIKAVGTSQELKSKFGRHYTITMVAPDVDSRSKIKGECLKLLGPSGVEKTTNFGIISGGLLAELYHLSAILKKVCSSNGRYWKGLLVVVFMGKGTSVGLSSDEEPSPYEESAVNTGSHDQTSSDLSTSSGSSRIASGGEPQPTSSDVNGTNGCLRQLWLLTRKNFILTRRNKLWTFFELVVPIAFALSLTLLSLGGKPDKELGSFQLSSLISTHFYLDGRDLYRHVELFSKSCSHDEAHIAYL